MWYLYVWIGYQYNNYRQEWRNENQGIYKSRIDSCQSTKVLFQTSPHLLWANGIKPPDNLNKQWYGSSIFLITGCSCLTSLQPIVIIMIASKAYKTIQKMGCFSSHNRGQNQHYTKLPTCQYFQLQLISEYGEGFLIQQTSGTGISYLTVFQFATTGRQHHPLWTIWGDSFEVRCDFGWYCVKG